MIGLGIGSLAVREFIGRRIFPEENIQAVVTDVDVRDAKSLHSKKVMTRLFGDKEGLKNVVAAFATYVYKVHNGEVGQNPSLG